MELGIYIALGIFGALGLFLIVISYRPVIKEILRRIKTRKNTDVSDVDSVEHELAVLSGPVKAASKAAAFVKLMKLEYVLVHVMVNKGNSYDDEVQSERFQKSLTPDLMLRLNALEGKYE